MSTLIGRWRQLRPIADNSAWLLFDRAVRLGLGLLVNIWVARYLGPEQFGLLNYAAAFVALFFPLVTLGLDGIVVRDLARDPARKDELLGTVFTLRLVGALVTVAVSIGLILWLRPHECSAHWLVGITALGVIFQACDIIDLWFQSQLQSRLTVYAKNSAFLLFALIKVGLIKLGAPLVAFAWAGSAELAVGAVGLIISYRCRYRLSAWRSSVQYVGQLLRAGWPLVLAAPAVLMQAKIDQVLIGDLVGDAELGNYSVALRLVEVLGFIPVIVQISVAPAVARAKTRSEEEYYGLLLNLYRLMFVLFIVTALPLCLLSTRFVILLFGSEYAAAAVLLPFFSIRIFFTNFGVVKGLFITNDNLFRYSLAMAVVGAVLNLALNYLLIPRYSALGAIAAMAISFLVNTFLLDLFYPETKRNLRIMVRAILTPWKLQLTPHSSR